VLGLLVLANLAVQLDALDVLPGAGQTALRASLDLFVLLIALVGGRIVPAFTASALAARDKAGRVRPFSVRDRLALGSLAALLLSDLGNTVLDSSKSAACSSAIGGWRSSLRQKDGTPSPARHARAGRSSCARPPPAQRLSPAFPAL
jgi:uncharacterized protein involved in response to NO